VGSPSGTTLYRPTLYSISHASAPTNYAKQYSNSSPLALVGCGTMPSKRLSSSWTTCRLSAAYLSACRPNWRLLGVCSWTSVYANLPKKRQYWTSLYHDEHAWVGLI